jgi:DHA1 family tetracycline resistance protein-like MFS transporter
MQNDESSAAPPDATASAPTSNRSALLIVFLVVFIDLLGFGIVVPLMPIYASDILEPLFPGDDAGVRAWRGVVLGLLMSSFSLMQFVFAPIWGRISDRVGRRPILLVGLAGSVVFYTLFGIASDLAEGGHLQTGLALMFLARLGAGVAGATIATAQAVIADCTPPERRAHGMALIGIAFGIGFTFGPLLGFLSLFVDVAGAAGYAAAALSLVATILALRRLPETLRPDHTHAHRRWLDWNGLRNALRTPTVGLLVVTFFLATFAFAGLESTLALVNKLLLTGEATRDLLTREEAKTALRQNFLIFAYVGLVLMLVQGLIYRRLVQRVGEVRFLKLGLILMALGLAGGVGVLLARPNIQSTGLIMTLALFAFTFAVMGFAFLTPSAQALISRRSDPAKQGEILGVNQSAAAMARILGPVVSITLFYVSAPTYILPYVLGASLLVLVFLLSMRLRQE